MVCKWLKTQFAKAERLVRSWGLKGKSYSATPEYQAKLRKLFTTVPYRLDTNFAKMDRIVHPEIEAFKNRIYHTDFHGMTIGQWNRLLARGEEATIRQMLDERFQISDVGQPVVASG